jgi:DNA mismatch repair ATPase MutS
VLAAAGGPVCAASLKLPPLQVWTSMRVTDSLAQGVSFYLAELRRLKAVIDGAEGRRDDEGSAPPPLRPSALYLLDEILQGTNTTERRIAARRVVLHLVRRGAIGAVSTHDLDLADPAQAPALAAAVRPIHFTESVGSNGMTFDFRARPGVATSTNALRLMELVGLDLPDET